MNKRYIIASSKPWHRDEFARITKEDSCEWSYVSTPDELSQLVAIVEPRYIFFLHWNWLVAKEIWSRYECVCFHMTDVPYGRGGSPLQNLIVAGLDRTCVTALRMVEEMDAGPVYAKRPMSLEGRAEEIYQRAGLLSWEMIRWIIATQPEPVPQVGEVTRFKRRKPEQSILPQAGTIASIYDHIRMLDAPTYPHAFVTHGDFQLEFTDASLHEQEVHARVVIRIRREQCLSK